MMHRGKWIAAFVFFVLLWGNVRVEAGMPALLPTNWKAGTPNPSWGPSSMGGATVDAQWQALSFFLACLFAAPVALRLVWNVLRWEIPRLPALGYRQALAIVILWGLCFVVVLTMISGARELMTPGAWKKQGWTYQVSDEPRASSLDERRQALESLRFLLWQHAATHGGEFPSLGAEAIPAEAWTVPGWPGLQFVYLPGRSANAAAELLAFEPEVSRDERFVLFTNGLIGTMRTSEIERHAQTEDAP